MTELYAQCTTFMIHCANLLGVTYRDTNAGLFFLLWPATTLALLSWMGWNALALHRLVRIAVGPSVGTNAGVTTPPMTKSSSSRD